MVGILIMVLVCGAFVLKSAFPVFQLVFCLQVVFLSLGSIKNINPLLSGLTEFGFIKGFRSTRIYF